MKKMVQAAATVLLIVLVTLVDIPLLPVTLIPDAEAIFGVRRRTAVIAYSAGAATASVASQSAAASQPQSAPPPQQTSAPQSASAVPIGTVAAALPEECVSVTIGNVQYHECQGSYYRTAFQGNSLVYVVVEKPL